MGSLQSNHVKVSKMGPIQYNQCPNKKEKFDTNLTDMYRGKTTGRQIGRRKPHDWKDVNTSQGTSAAKEDFPLEPLETSAWP